jgi:Na+/melibiose symporter-like transporter
MRLFLAGAPTATALLALVALRFYPITAETAARTRAILEQRRGAANLTELSRAQ